jgi:hypothetical protein
MLPCFWRGTFGSFNSKRPHRGNSDVGVSMVEVGYWDFLEDLVDTVSFLCNRLAGIFAIKAVSTPMRFSNCLKAAEGADMVVWGKRHR